MNRSRYGSYLWAHLRLQTERLTAGGSWTSQLAHDVQSNLRYFFFDGVLSSASDAVNLTYLTLFVLALGANASQIGLMSALGSLSATLLLLPGAFLAERSKLRKPIVVISGGLISRMNLLLLALVPLAVKGPAMVTLAIIMKVIMDGASNLGLPAWVSMTADIVPLSWRGRYFGTRNLVMGIASMTSTLLVGQLITGVGSVTGYQLAYGLAFSIGMLSTFSYSHIKEPLQVANPQAAASYSFSSLLTTLRTDQNFSTFCMYSMLWNFSLNVAGPFFNVYLVQNLNASAAMVGFLSIVASLAGLPAQRIFGQLSDRLGPRKILLLSGFLIPSLPFSWFFVKAAWHVIPINILSGILWAGYNLAAFNFALSLYPPEQRARYSALLQISIAVSSALGALIGGQIAIRWGIPVLFLLSGAGRLAAAAVFSRFVSQPSPLPAGAAPSGSK